MNLKIPTRTVHVEDETTVRDTFTASWTRHSTPVVTPVEDDFQFSFSLKQAYSDRQAFDRTLLRTGWVPVGAGYVQDVSIRTPSTDIYFIDAPTVIGISGTPVTLDSYSVDGQFLRLTFFAKSKPTKNYTIQIDIDSARVALENETMSKTYSGTVTSINPSSGTTRNSDNSVTVAYSVSYSGNKVTVTSTSVNVHSSTPRFEDTEIESVSVDYNDTSYDYYYTATSATHNYDGDVDTATYVSGSGTNPTTIHKSGKTVYAYWYSSSYKSGSVSAQLDVTYDSSYDEERANVYFNGQLVDFVYFNGEKFPK